MDDLILPDTRIVGLDGEPIGDDPNDSETQTEEEEPQVPKAIANKKLGDKILISDASFKGLKSSKIVNSKLNNRFLVLKVGKSKLSSFDIGKFFVLGRCAIYMVTDRDAKKKLVAFHYVGSSEEEQAMNLLYEQTKKETHEQSNNNRKSGSRSRT